MSAYDEFLLVLEDPFVFSEQHLHRPCLLLRAASDLIATQRTSLLWDGYWNEAVAFLNKHIFKTSDFPRICGRVTPCDWKAPALSFRSNFSWPMLAVARIAKRVWNRVLGPSFVQPSSARRSGWRSRTIAYMRRCDSDEHPHRLTKKRQSFSAPCLLVRQERQFRRLAPLSPHPPSPPTACSPGRGGEVGLPPRNRGAGFSR